MNHSLGNSLIKTFRALFTRIAPTLFTRILFRHHVGYKLNLDNPKTLTEKLQWLKLNEYYRNDLITKCIDKYLVREFVTEAGCQEILNELYGVWDDVEQIDWDALPNKFVLKCNHGCAYNIICVDKKTFNIEIAKKQLNNWMSQKYGLQTAEIIYSDLKPKIICEKFIESNDGKELKDYKIFCSYGVPKLIYVITGGHGSKECLDYYTTNWEWIPVNNGTLPNAGNIVPRPEMLDEMLEYAQKLSINFPIVRVDLYCESMKIIFGELTFLPTGGFSKYNPSEYDYIFGEMFNIDNLVKRKDKPCLYSQKKL